MEIIRAAYKCLKAYKTLVIVTFIVVIITSCFEGISLGMIIPLIQSMTGTSEATLKGIPILKILNFGFHGRAYDISLLFVMLFFLIIIKNTFSYISNMMITKLRMSVIRDHAARLMDRLIEYDMAYFDNAKTGHILNVLYGETMRIGGFVLSSLLFMANLANVIAYIILLFIIAFRLSVIIFVMIAIVMLPLEFVSKKLKKLGVHVSKAFSDYSIKITEIMGGIRVIKASGMEENEKKHFRALAEMIYKMGYKNNKYIYMLMPLCEVSVFGVIVLCFLLLINVAKIDILVAFPYVAAYLVVLVKVLTQLNSLNTKRSEAINNMAAISTYESLFNDCGRRAIRSGNRIVKSLNRSIEFRSVNFSYVYGKQVLHDVSMRIHKGHTTAIVGPSGAGKSTIINLILRFYDVDSGNIKIDDIDLTSLDLSTWRRLIGLVSQEVYIFNASVRDNIAYGSNPDDLGSIQVAAKKAFAHDFIKQMPNGYDTVLGERGLKLSGGQKQRISIARAIMRNPEILILDEATSALDAETERLVRDAVAGLVKDRTVIAIAHRLSTIVSADNIVVLDNGRVIEEGRHTDLIKSSCVYKKLYELQLR